MQKILKGLYVVATPIGNLGDMTARAIEVLQNADLIACEDTRITGKLCTHFGISTRRLAYHEHNADAMRPKILAILESGGAVALVSDAGTPLISDPGYRLVQAVRAAGHNITPLPGASAVLAALTVAGLPTDRFLFAGFLPQKQGARQKELSLLATIPATLVVYESPRRLAAALADMADILGDRAACICREITKLHEEARPGTLAELAAHYAESPTPKGEVVVVIGPPMAAEETAPEDVDALLRAALDKGLSLRDAARDIAATTGISKKQAYSRALQLVEK